MFSLRFTVSKLLINLRRESRVRENFSCTKISRTQVWHDLRPSQFMFKITLSKMHNLCFMLHFN